MRISMPSGEYVMQHAARPRRYLLHLPAGREDEDGLPVVIALHGAPGYARNLAENSGLNAKSDSAGFIVIYPDGTSAADPLFLNWNSGHCCGYAWANNIDDVAFLKELTARIIKEYRADKRRVYVAGFSKGGMMAHRLACEAATVFAGIADISGALNFENCRPQRAIDILISHGRADRNVLYGNGLPAKIRPLPDNEDRPVAFATDFWGKMNDCVPGGVRFQGKAEIQTYACHKGGLRVVSLSAEGHTWPGGGTDLVGADTPTHVVTINDLMWDFWSEAYFQRRQESLRKK